MSLYLILPSRVPSIYTSNALLMSSSSIFSLRDFVGGEAFRELSLDHQAFVVKKFAESVSWFFHIQILLTLI